MYCSRGWTGLRREGEVPQPWRRTSGDASPVSAPPPSLLPRCAAQRVGRVVRRAPRRPRHTPAGAGKVVPPCAREQCSTLSLGAARRSAAWTRVAGSSWRPAGSVCRRGDFRAPCAGMTPGEKGYAALSDRQLDFMNAEVCPSASCACRPRTRTLLRGDGMLRRVSVGGLAAGGVQLCSGSARVRAGVQMRTHAQDPLPTCDPPDERARANTRTSAFTGSGAEHTQIFRAHNPQ